MGASNFNLDIGSWDTGRLGDGTFVRNVRNAKSILSTACLLSYDITHITREFVTSVWNLVISRLPGRLFLCGKWHSHSMILFEILQKMMVNFGCVYRIIRWSAAIASILYPRSKLSPTHLSPTHCGLTYRRLGEIKLFGQLNGRHPNIPNRQVAS